MLFERSNASSGVRNVITLNTGPKISSDATRCSSLAGAGEDVRRTGEGRRVKTNLCACVMPVMKLGGNQ